MLHLVVLYTHLSTYSLPSFRLFRLCLKTTEKVFTFSAWIKFYFHSGFARNKHDFQCVCFENNALLVSDRLLKFTFLSSKSLQSLPRAYIVESKDKLFMSNSI